MTLPLMPVSVEVIRVIVRSALPVLLTEIDCVPLLPMTTLPKLTLTGLAVNCPTGAAEPVPVTGKIGRASGRERADEIGPDAVPIEAGENWAWECEHGYGAIV